VQILRDHGWTEPQIAEAVYITAMFAFFIGSPTPLAFRRRAISK
jgi:hypothetical protein